MPCNLKGATQLMFGGDPGKPCNLGFHVNESYKMFIMCVPIIKEVYGQLPSAGGTYSGELLILRERALVATTLKDVGMGSLSPLMGLGPLRGDGICLWNGAGGL